MQEMNLLGKRVKADKTKLLLRFDGNTADVVGNPIFRATGISYVDNQKFGKKGITFARNGLVEVLKNDNLTLAGDMTIEFIVTMQPVAGGTESMAMSHHAGTFIDYLAGTGWLVSFSLLNNRTAFLTIPINWLDGIPHHFAASRKDNVFSIYCDGVFKGTVASSIALDGTSTVIGNYSGAFAYGMSNGNIQEFRISNVARYNAPFTPPTSPFVLD